MNHWSNKLRLRWALATKSFGSSVDLVETIYRIYLNHSKVIHFRDGYPVYSLTTPALLSRPAANFLARTLFRVIQNKNLPNMVSFAVNDACNANCQHCSFFSGVDDTTRTVLTLPQCQRFIRQAQELGVSVVNFVGGEPLLRADLPEIIRAVDKDRSTTVLYTNGWLLEGRARELRAAGLDSVFVSLDGATAERHDAFRRTPGLFERALRGIRRAKALGFSVGFSCCLTPEAFRAGELTALVELAKKTGVHEVLVFDALPTGRYAGRLDLVSHQPWVDELIAQTERFNRDARAPGVLAFPYATSHRSVGCSCGTSYFYLSPYGDVMSCDFNHAKFGNVLAEPLYQIWDRLTSQADFQRAKWGGCKVKDAGFRARESVVTESGCGCHALPALGRVAAKLSAV